MNSEAIRHAAPKLALTCLITVSLVVFAGPHETHAANATWNGTTDVSWLTDSNWNAAPAPGTGNTATFNNAGNSNTTLDLGGGVTIQQITFDTASAAAYTLGNSPAGSQTLTFNAGGVTVNSNVTTGQLINASVVLGAANGNQSYTFTNNTTTGSLTVAGGISSTTTGTKTLTLGGNGDIALNGAITNGSGTLALAKVGPGTLTLSNTSNTFTGGIKVGTNSTNGGTIRTTASDVLPAGVLNLTSGNIDLNGNSDTVGSGSGTAVYFGATDGPLASRTSTLSTGAGTLTLNGIIEADSNARQQMIITGKLDLGGATRDIKNHTYGAPGTGNERVQIRVQADISGSGVGVNLIRGNDGSATVGAVFSGNNSYTGTTTMNNAALEADSVNALGDGGNITFSGGGGAILRYTANSAGTDWSTRFKSSTGQPIRLDTNGQTVTLAGIIDNTNTQGVTKLGTGNLILSGPNTYTGNTTVNAGTLKTTANDTIPNASSIVVSGNAAGVTATFDLNGNSDTISALTFGGSTTTSGAALTTGVGTLTLGNNVTYDSSNNPLGATLSGNLALGASTRTFTVNDSTTAADDLTVSAAITGGAGVGLTKSGTGKLVLSGPNSYAGATLSNGGLLQFNTLASMAGSGRNITATSPGAVGIGYVPGTTIQDDLLSRIVSNSTGAVALTSNTSENFDFSSGGPANNFTALSLGASGNITYSGTLTPNGTTYRLGSVGGTLTMANPIAGSGKSLVINGNVILTTTSDFASTTVNSGTLQLNMGANTNMVNNSAVVFDFTGSQTYSGTISGTGSLTKNGGGTLTLTVPQTYSGTTTVSGGKLVLAAGHHTLAVKQPLTLSGGSTLDLGSSTQYVGTLTSTNAADVITGSGRLTTNPTGAASFAGTIQGSLTLAKVGAQTMTMTNDNTTSGSLLVLGGGLTLKDNGAFSNASGVIVVNDATLRIDNTGTANLANRLNDGKALSLNGGNITFAGASTPSSESLGAVSLFTGYNTLSVPTTVSTSALTLNSLTRITGALVNISSGSDNNMGQTGNKPALLVTGDLAGLSANLAPINGVVPGAYHYLNVDNSTLVNYVAAKGFGDLGQPGFGTAPATGTATSVSTDNVKGTWTVPSGGQSVNSISSATGMSFTDAADTLTITSGMIIANSQSGGTPFGTTALRGKITSGTSELFAIRYNGNGTPSHQVWNSVITDNSNPVKFILAGNSVGDGRYWPVLTAQNTYSGGTVISGVGVKLVGTNPGDVVIPAGGVFINDGAQLVESTNSGQIHSGNSITINGGGSLIRHGTNTVASINFNSNGGTTTPSVIPYLTVAYGDGVQNPTYTGNGTLVVADFINSTPSNVAVTPIIGNASGNGVGILDLNAQTGASISVSALPEGNFANNLTPFNGLTINSLIQNGGIVKSGNGVLNLTNTGSTYAGQLIVQAGVLNVPTVNNVSANGVLGNSGNSVILGSIGNTATLEYTGGTTSTTKPFTLQTSATARFQVDQPATVLTVSGLVDGSGNLVKTGDGTLTLSNAANTYTGNTTVASGAFILPDNAGLKFVVTNSASNKITGTGTATLNGDFTIDTSAVSASSGSWSLVDAATLTETFGATFTIAGAGWTELSNVWTLIDGSKTWTFTEATGVLTLTSPGGPTPFETFMAGFPSIPVADRDPGDDPDKDGANNLCEFAFNGDPNNGGSMGNFYVELKDNGDVGSANELTFTCAMRRSATAFAPNGNNAQQSAALIDGLSYTVEADADLLGTWNSAVSYIGKSNTPPAGSGLPTLTGDWEYRTFSAFDGVLGKGFIRARVAMP